MAARQVLFEKNAVVLLEAPPLGGGGSNVEDASHILVPHNALRPFRIIGAPVAAADTGSLNLKQASIGGDVGKGVLADLRFEGGDGCGRTN